VKNVTEKALEKAHKEDPVQHLVLAAPTVDITNLDTSKVRPNDDIEQFKEEVIVSCQNMILTAQNALSKHPSLQNVTVMEHPPRFDTANVDPCSLKPSLAKFANNVLKKVLSTSNMKDKISIGKHNLNCDGKIRQARYTRTHDRRYDGVHMYGASGRNAYTKSITNIIRSTVCPHTAPAPAQPSRTQDTDDLGMQNNYNVQVNNFFDILGN
jgi:hypothetical protein